MRKQTENKGWGRGGREDNKLLTWKQKTLANLLGHEETANRKQKA
jgi:hypothetical protein